MSVFTTVSREQLESWLKHYSIGALVSFEGIAAGIENTNYFVTTSEGRHVLTSSRRCATDAGSPANGRASTQSFLNGSPRQLRLLKRLDVALQSGRLFRICVYVCVISDPSHRDK